MIRNEIEILDKEIAILEHRKYEIYRDWSNKVKNDMRLIGTPKFIRIFRENDKCFYMMVTCIGGGVYRTPYGDDTKLYKAVTNNLIFSGFCLNKTDDWYHIYTDLNFRVVDRYEIISVKEFDEYFEEFIKTCLTPTNENMKKAYSTLDLEFYFDRYPEYFDREEVKFFIRRFQELDEIETVSNPEFNEWL